jgi:uncharacterized glyoxalase superfamily protein PhnB
MISNRSIPRATVIPELFYTDIGEAITWLNNAFGFSQSIADVDPRDWGGTPGTL